MPIVRPAEPTCAVREAWPRFVPLFAVVLALVIGLAWSNTLAAPFELDDASSIVANPTLRSLSSLEWLRPPSAHGETVSGRPMLNLTLALNYAAGGVNVRGYHVANLAIHVLSALTLFGLVRRSLLLPAVPQGLAHGSVLLAFLIAGLWALHPLQTQAVTYVIQRAESLMTLFYLLTLYGFVRLADSSGSEPARTGARRLGAHFWGFISVGSCLLGMATKENMVSAPIAVLLYDRAFVAGGFAAGWRRRRGYYAALGATWLVLVVLVLSAGGNRGGSAGFDVGVRWWDYLLTQFPALTRYLALSVWPQPLVFEYGAFWIEHASDVAASMTVVIGLLIAAGYALWRWPKLGFIAGVGLAVLAPTSLVPGPLQMIVEHRMYLPLASVVVLVVLGVRHLVAPLGFKPAAMVGGIAVAALALLTFTRNAVYASELALWRDTVAKRPENPRARNNLGLALQQAGNEAEAIAEFRKAIALQPNHAFAHANLGQIFLARKQWTAAAAELALATAADPYFVSAQVNLGVALSALGRAAEAESAYRAALQGDPAAADARVDLAALLLDRGDDAGAEAQLRQALATAPTLPAAHYHQARRFEKRGELAAAEGEYREAGRLSPGWGEVPLALGNLLVARGDSARAEASYRRAIELSPDQAEPRYALANVLAERQEFEPAMVLYTAALRLDPGHIGARNNLANCEFVTGRLSEAIGHYEEVLKARPTDAEVAHNLQLARQQLAARDH